MTEFRKATHEDLTRVRNMLIVVGDAAFGLHSQIEDFLSGADEFGIMIGDGALAFYSQFNKLYIHTWVGPTKQLDELVKQMGNPVCQVFLRDTQEPQPTWTKLLDVFPGKRVDHEAYSGVFWRSSPRFHGVVYEIAS